MEWYILLASVRGTSIRIETTSKSVRMMSAFWDGGREGAEDEKRLCNKRESARKKRMGRIVNV
jgi:hypothetical protein